MQYSVFPRITVYYPVFPVITVYYRVLPGITRYSQVWPGVAWFVDTEFGCYTDSTPSSFLAADAFMTHIGWGRNPSARHLSSATLNSLVCDVRQISLTSRTSPFFLPKRLLLLGLLLILRLILRLILLKLINLLRISTTRTINTIHTTISTTYCCRKIKPFGGSSPKTQNVLLQVVDNTAQNE